MERVRESINEAHSGEDFGLRVGWAGARDKRVLNAFREVDRAFCSVCQ